MTSVACMMQRGGRPWFRASRMACSSVTLRVQLLVREERHKVRLKVTISICIFIRFSLREWVQNYLMNRISLLFGNTVLLCQKQGVYLPISQIAVLSKHTVCIWHNKSICSDNKHLTRLNTKSFSTYLHGSKAVFATDGDWNKHQQKTKARQKSNSGLHPDMTNLWQNSVLLHQISPRAFLLLLTPHHCHRILPASPSLISSLMNHFTWHRNVSHREQTRGTRRITNLPIFALDPAERED